MPDYELTSDMLLLSETVDQFVRRNNVYPDKERSELRDSLTKQLSALSHRVGQADCIGQRDRLKIRQDRMTLSLITLRLTS